MKSRWLVFLLIFGFAASILGWVYESRVRPRVEPAPLAFPDNIDYFLTDFTYRAMNEDGAPDYAFDSPRLEHYPLNDISQIELPSLQIYRDDNRWQIDAKRGEYDHPVNTLRLTRQVVMRKLGKGPLELLTDSVRFEPDRDLVAIDSPVVMLRGANRIEADRAEFDLAEGIYRFSRARATYDDPNS